jgi:hypothetical protein
MLPSQVVRTVTQRIVRKLVMPVSPATRPAPRWANSRREVTLEQLETDIATLAKAEAQYEAEAARSYDFTPASQVSPTRDTEPTPTDLVEQSA